MGNDSLLTRFMSKKGLFNAFWMLAITMVVALVYFSANLVKEVPPLPSAVKSISGEVLYTEKDLVDGKGLFQEFDLMDYGTLLGMGAYLGPDFSTELFHKRAEFLYDYYAKEKFNKSSKELSIEERGMIKEIVKKDFKQTILTKDGVVYTTASTEAFKANRAYIINFLVNGDKARAWRGGIIRPEEASKIAAFFDWAQLVSSSLRPGTDRTWSNNWPKEPLIDQDVGWIAHKVSLWEWLLLWPLTIFVIYVIYEFFIKDEHNSSEPLEEPLKITKFFPSQEKLLKYIPIVALFSMLQLVIGGYLAHTYADPLDKFIISQDILPFNIMRALHLNLAIVWVAIGWLVGGLFIAPLVAGKDLRFPRLVDLLWVALLVVGGGGLIGIYLGASGQLRESWFWFGNEGREYLELGRVWDIGLLVGLVLWFAMVYSTIRQAKENSVLVGTIIWSAFGIATLYIAGMMPINKIIPNFTVDDYYRWWVVHLWVELTFELFAAGVLAYLSVALGLVRKSVAERIMLFELVLVMATGTLGVGHHYWWQGTDEYWIAMGGLFSAIEPLPLVILMIEAIKEQKHIKQMGQKFEWGVPFMWLAGSGFLNWLGAGWLGMVINTPTIGYYSHGTYLIMPHGHVALLGAFGYISYAFIYMTARANALAKGLVWTETLSKWGFWLLTIGVIGYAIPTLVIGFHQTQVAYEMGYFATRSREILEPMKTWMWIRIVPDGMMVIGGAVIFFDTVQKIYFARKAR